MFKDSNNLKMVDYHNNFIKSNFTEVNLCNYTKGNYCNLFYDFLENNCFNKYNIITEKNTINNNKEKEISKKKTHSSFNFSTKILNKLNNFISNEIIKNNSLVSSFNDLGKNQIKGRNSIRRNFGINNNSFSQMNKKHVCNSSYGMKISKTFEKNYQKETLEIRLSFIILTKNKKLNISENYILNVNLFSHLEKENLIYMDYFLLRDKNFNLMDIIKFQINYESYFLEMNSLFDENTNIINFKETNKEYLINNKHEIEDISHKKIRSKSTSSYYQKCEKPKIEKTIEERLSININLF